MHAVAAIRRKDAPASLAASSRFGAFKPESEKAVRIAKVEMNPALESMKRAWRECKGLDIGGYCEHYAERLDKIKNLRYSAKDAEGFSIVLAEFQNEKDFSDKAGFFLSALVNNSQEDKFVIHTSHIAEPINYIGAQNTKRIIVEGNAGDWLGFLMGGGSIIVRGNAGDWVGGMEGGIITVEGDVQDYVGTGMKSGIITVNGNTGDHVGNVMKGGEIHIFGDTFVLSDDIQGGKIFRKGEQIFPM